MSPRNAAGSKGHDGVGIYVFCLVRAGAARAAVGHGLAEDTPLRALVHEDVAAVCCEVPLHDWTGEAGEVHLKDLGWLGPHALRHEEVIEQMMRVSPVLPLRFGCLFSSEDQLVELLWSRRTRIAAFIEAVSQEQEKEAEEIEARLRELYQRLESGQLEEQEFEAQEAELLDRLDALTAGEEAVYEGEERSRRRCSGRRPLPREGSRWMRAR